MEKIIRQFTYIILGGAMALNLGCDLDVEDADFAPSSLDERIFFFTGTATESDGTTNAEEGTATFSASTLVLTNSDGSPETLNYIYTKTSHHSGSLTWTYPSEPGALIIQMSFTSPTSGSYTGVDTEGSTEVGTFTQTN